MHYLIDGHNLIAHMANIDLDDPNDEALLVLRLRSWLAGGRKRRATVIFDGGLPGGRSRFHSTNQLNVIFASTGKTADALLIRRVMKVKNPAEFTLISSDQEVIAAARARKMSHQSAEQFAARLDEAGLPAESESPPVGADEADEPPVSQDEVAEWLALFDAAPRPRRPAAKPSPAQEPPAKKPREAGQAQRPARARRSVDPASLKRGDDALSDDDLDEWLRLFGREG